MTTRTYQFLLAGVVVLLGLYGHWFLTAQHEAISNAVFENEKQATAEYIRGQAKTLVSEGMFTTASGPVQRAAFAKFFKKIQSVDIVRIKVWDKNYTVIWSDLSETIGQQFKDNHEVEEALDGEIELELSAETGKSEHVTERQFQNIVEIYVPITDVRGSIVGVIEVYKQAAGVEEKIDGPYQTLLMQTIFGSLIGFGLIAFVLRRFIR